MTISSKILSLAAASVMLGGGMTIAQTVTLTPQDREIVIAACETGQDILPIAYDNGSPDGMFAVPIIDENGEAISAVILTRRLISSLPQCDLPRSVQEFANDAEQRQSNGDDA